MPDFHAAGNTPVSRMENRMAGKADSAIPYRFVVLVRFGGRIDRAIGTARKAVPPITHARGVKR